MNKISEYKPKPLQSTYADNEIDLEKKFMSTGSNNHLFKGGLINPPKNVPNTILSILSLG